MKTNAHPPGWAAHPAVDLQYSQEALRQGWRAELIRHIHRTPHDTILAPGIHDNAGRPIKIGIARGATRHATVSALLKNRYAWRGYQSVAPDPGIARHMVGFTVEAGSEVVGTMSIIADSDDGLLSDIVFHDRIDLLRQSGRRVCEFGKLAIKDNIRSHFAFGAIIRVCIVCAHTLLGHSDLIIEVNPRHSRFYEHMMGFKILDTAPMNPRVGAPAVLLGVEFDYLLQEIERFGGKPELAAQARSLFPYFPAPTRTSEIARHLLP